MELAQPHRPFRTPYALNFQAALLFLITILPVLLVVGWFNHQYVRAALEEQINLDTRARTTEIEERFANVLLRELERLMTLGQSPTLPGLAHPAAGAADRAAAQQAYERATQVDAIREQYVTNAAGQVLKRFREEYPNRAVVLLADPQGGLESVTT